MVCAPSSSCSRQRARPARCANPARSRSSSTPGAWHLARAGVDLEAFFLEHADDVGHIQIGDMPDRGGPGTGPLPIAALIDSALARNHRGRIAHESSHFKTDPFEWMPAWYATAD